MTTITEYKNDIEVTETFESLDEVKESALGWLEVYEDIDEQNYQDEMNTVNNTDDIKIINEVMHEFGYSYKN